jgi:hypothetical protein
LNCHHALFAIAKDLRLGASFKIVAIEGLRIKREFLVAYGKGPEPQGLVHQFRRFLIARAGAQRTLEKSKRP